MLISTRRAAAQILRLEILDPLQRGQLHLGDRALEYALMYWSVECFALVLCDFGLQVSELEHICLYKKNNIAYPKQ